MSENITNFVGIPINSDTAKYLYEDTTAIFGISSAMSAKLDAIIKKTSRDSELEAIKKTIKFWGKAKKREYPAPRQVEATPQELEEFQELLFKNPKNAPFEHELGKRGELGEILGEDFIPLEDEILPNGKRLSGAEQNAISMYTAKEYTLINGTLNNDATSLALWLKVKSHNKKLDSDGARQELLQKAQPYVDKIAHVLASGINKLPPYQGLIFRGDTLTPEKIQQLREGEVIITNKFLSCSGTVATADFFARKKSIERMEIEKVEYKPAIYVFVSNRARNISPYSTMQGESEKIYLPRQAFRAIDVDEKCVPGLAVILFKELN